jgi:hypothetical protein
MYIPPQSKKMQFYDFSQGVVVIADEPSTSN